MKLFTFLGISILTFFLTVLSCSNYGLNQDKTKKEDDKKKCEAALAVYLSCTSSNPAMSACDSLYTGVLGVCGGGGGSGGGGGY
ncbi:hypothetical protein [Leptospira alstonii]|uniref:Lipoprotein n=2 Tax=Leptospira alstonii TaxID=28452 RepID=T0HD66_9LEPT|nr:hypothetical protein [Leptospira alstonii]EMJ97074.1 putative lipoprotein [Leptospira alstonii serovar Sichuan str. 79601]EQA81738.1 putative lipoprotein [Leptospira alstonii serovar Pingchang str. 80-412]